MKLEISFYIFMNDDINNILLFYTLTANPAYSYLLGYDQTGHIITMGKETASGDCNRLRTVVCVVKNREYISGQ
jgi:hypothetical protein